MRYRDMWKLVPVEAAMVILAFTLLWTIQEAREPEHITLPVIRRITILDEPAEVETDSKINLSGYPVEESTDTDPIINLDSADEEILLKIAMSEAEGESIEGKALVMLAVLNRVQSDEFSDTVSEVVFQDQQFSPVMDGRYYTAIPNDDCYAALELIESGWDESQGAMYFENYGANCWHRRNLEFLYQEGNHNFYR